MVLLVSLIFYYSWSRFVQPRLNEEWAYKEGFVSQDNGTYGIARGGDMDHGLVRIKDLDRDLIPGGQADPEGKRRLVFGGDVHGCKKELLELLEKVKFNEETDHLILTGDIISKGPDNPGVLDELLRLKATSVRGNHEDRILHVADALDEDSAPPTEQSSSIGFAKDAALLKQLKPQHLKYLRDMPLMLHVATLPQALPATTKTNSPINEHLFVVHAGLVPGVHLSKQDPYFVMNMRSIDRRTHVPSAMRSPDKNARPWFDIWGWYNHRIFKKRSLKGFIIPAIPFLAENEVDPASESSGWFGTMWKNFFGSRKSAIPQVVVYGHDSKTGLQIHRWSKGLDSGCVGGGKLTAMVLDAKGRTELFSVGCKNYRD